MNDSPDFSDRDRFPLPSDGRPNPKRRARAGASSHDGRHEELTRVALTYGYCREHLNGENVIFARQGGHDGN